MTVPHKKLTQEQMAYWIMSHPDGVTADDIAAEFSLTNREANNYLHNIRLRDRYDTRWVKAIGWPHSKNRTPARLFVDAVNAPVFSKNPWGAIVGVRPEPKGDDADVVHFSSVYQADTVGGFCNVAIYACLNGDNHTHGGYRWMKKSDYEMEITQ
jgi:hypothetical protein